MFDTVPKDSLTLMFDTYLKNTSDMVFFKDKNLVYLAASQAFATMVSLADYHDIAGKTDFDLFDYDLAQRYIEDDRSVIQSEKPIINRLEPLPERDGKKRYSSTYKYLMKDEAGNTAGVYGISRDITAEIDLKEEQERRELSEFMYDDVLEADLTENKMIRQDNSVWAKNAGLPADCSFTDAVSIMVKQYVHPTYAKDFQEKYNIEHLTSLFSAGNCNFSHMTYLKNKQGDYKWLEFHTTLYFSKISKTLRFNTFLNDLDEQVKEQEVLRKKAETDSLTGLLNHKSIVKQINKCLTGYESRMKHALLFVDLDGFKAVNDTMGHPFGDKVLKEVSQKLNGIVSDGDLVGRIGGDEFLLLLKNVHSKEAVERVAREILNQVHFRYHHNDRDIEVTCSIGISLYAEEGKTFEQLYQEADNAMYQAKKSGKHCLDFAD